jgi:hypothetical protein
VTADSFQTSTPAGYVVDVLRDLTGKACRPLFLKMVWDAAVDAKFVTVCCMAKISQALSASLSAQSGLGTGFLKDPCYIVVSTSQTATHEFIYTNLLSKKHRMIHGFSKPFYTANMTNNSSRCTFHSS